MSVLSRDGAMDRELATVVGEYYDDPLGFVEDCFSWGHGELAPDAGPDAWQRDFLARLGAQVRARGFDGSVPVAPIRMAASKGHGVGGSTLAAWLVCWIMSTRPHARGTITANTYGQLETKTWAAVQRWARLCLTASWFLVTRDAMRHRASPDTWFCAPQSCKDDNSEAFAGQHAKNSTSFYVFDEDSGISDLIHQVSEGGLTDGEPMVFRFGNPTRADGSFHACCFGRDRGRWDVVVVDSRTSRFANQDLIAEWIADHGEDSDFVRVRVRGLPPRASDLQFIDSDRISAAQSREVHPLADEPLVCGLDVARGGMDSSVFWFRRGPDARSIRPIVVPGEELRDSMRLATLATEVLSRQWDGRTVAALFVDGSGGYGGPVVDRLQQLGYTQAVEVQFGAHSPDPDYANMRAFMWARLRDWLAHGAIPRDAQLEQDLTGPGYAHDKQDRLVLEAKDQMKKRGLASPDRADALALTFAQKVLPRHARKKLVTTARPTRGWQG